MKNPFRSYRPLAPVFLALATWSGTATAAHIETGVTDLRLGLPTAASSQQARTTPLWLAANGSGMSDAGSDQGAAKSQWREHWFTANKAHEYMGLGSLILAGLTVVTAPDGEGSANGQAPSGKDLHQALAYGATALGVGAVTTGFIYHLDDIHWDNGITDPDNLHMLLGLLGTAGYLAAVADRPKSPDYSSGSHATYGIIGAVSMIGAIKLEW